MGKLSTNTVKNQLKVIKDKSTLKARYIKIAVRKDQYYPFSVQ